MTTNKYISRIYKHFRDYKYIDDHINHVRKHLHQMISKRESDHYLKYYTEAREYLDERIPFSKEMLEYLSSVEIIYPNHHNIYTIKKALYLDLKYDDGDPRSYVEPAELTWHLRDIINKMAYELLQYRSFGDKYKNKSFK